MFLAAPDEAKASVGVIRDDVARRVLGVRDHAGRRIDVHRVVRERRVVPPARRSRRRRRRSCSRTRRPTRAARSGPSTRIPRTARSRRRRLSARPCRSSRGRRSAPSRSRDCSGCGSSAGATTRPPTSPALPRARMRRMPIASTRGDRHPSTTASARTNAAAATKAAPPASPIQPLWTATGSSTYTPAICGKSWANTVTATNAVVAASAIHGTGRPGERARHRDDEQRREIEEVAVADAREPAAEARVVRRDLERQHDDRHQREQRERIARRTFATIHAPPSSSGRSATPIAASSRCAPACSNAFHGSGQRSAVTA